MRERLGLGELGLGHKRLGLQERELGENVSQRQFENEMSRRNEAQINAQIRRAGQEAEEGTLGKIGKIFDVAKKGADTVGAIRDWFRPSKK